MYPYRQELPGRRTDHPPERRQEARHETRLPFYLSLVDERPEQQHPGVAPRHITLTGHTHDISANGISLVGPLIRFGYRYLMGRNHSLNVLIELPSGPVEVEATPVRYVQLETGATDAGFIMSGEAASESSSNPAEICCLIGVIIKRMSEADRARYDEYLHMLERVEAEQMDFILSIEETLADDPLLVHTAA